jgi:hypothetical protein
MPLAAGYGLFHRELAAGAPNDVLGGSGVHKLEAIAEGVSLPNHGKNFDLAKGQRELHANYFTDRNFLAQHGGNPRLADVHGVAAHYRTTTRINADLYGQLEAAMAASFHEIVNLAGSQVTARFQGDGSPELEIGGIRQNFRRAWQVSP